MDQQHSLDPDHQHGHERTLAESAFPDDNGAASPDLRRLLVAADRGEQPLSYLRAVAGLCVERVLVPIVATATRVEQAGPSESNPLFSDKEAEMSVVLLKSADARLGLPVFTGMDALTAWNAQARPVPVTLDTAARSAVSDGAVALLVDLAGPHSLVIEGAVLAELAQGHRLIELPGEQFGWAMTASG